MTKSRRQGDNRLRRLERQTLETLIQFVKFGDNRQSRLERGKYKSYGLGTGGQTGFAGSSVTEGRSRRAWR